MDADEGRESLEGSSSVLIFWKELSPDSIPVPQGKRGRRLSESDDKGFVGGSESSGKHLGNQEGVWLYDRVESCTKEGSSQMACLRAKDT